MTALIGAVEAGGTKMVCAVGTGPDDIRDEVRFPTSSPDECLGQVVDYFQEWQVEHGEEISAIGYGTFGPCDPRPGSPTYGWVTTTPKPGWSDTDVVGRLRTGLDVPIGFDTDVNGAALGEHLWGAARDVDTFVYLTIGTGIGGGIIVDGRILHGLIHPEAGHVAMPRDPGVDPFPGVCPYHGDCLEGLAAGPAIGARWKVPAAELGPDHPAWDLEAHYLALACANLICTLSPERIVLGGGVMEQLHLFPKIRAGVRRRSTATSTPRRSSIGSTSSSSPGAGQQGWGLRLHRPGPTGVGRLRSEPGRGRTCGDPGSRHRPRGMRQGPLSSAAASSRWTPRIRGRRPVAPDVPRPAPGGTPQRPQRTSRARGHLPPVLPVAPFRARPWVEVLGAPDQY